MAVLDVHLPDGSIFFGIQTSQACSTVEKWKSSLESGEVCDKVLYASRLLCHRDDQRREVLAGSEELPRSPAKVFLGGPPVVITMLSFAFQKRYGPAVPPPPPPIDAAPGRAFACASHRCNYMVHTRPECGGFCCIHCSIDGSHCELEERGSYQCERRQAPQHAPKADLSWKPPGEKFAHTALTHKDLLRDEDSWTPLSKAKKQDYANRIKQQRAFEGPYIDYEVEGALDCKRKFLGRLHQHGWCLDCNPTFFCELAYEGFFPMGGEIMGDGGDPVQVMILCWDPKCSILDFQDVHISRQVRKRAKHFTMTVNTAFSDVLLGCVRMHGEAWLYRGHRSMMRQLHQGGYSGSQQIQFGLHSFELWNDQQRLVAGDLGYTVGGVYSSMTGFREKDTKHCGEVQMVLMAVLLHKMGFDWIDLGQVLKYKERLGAKIISRKNFLERLHHDRDKAPVFGHGRIAGGELLQYFSQVIFSSHAPAKPTSQLHQASAGTKTRKIHDRSSKPCKAAVEDQQVEGEREEDDLSAKEKMELEYVHCVECSARIAFRHGDEESSWQTHLQGLSYRIGRFCRASGAIASGPASRESCWFSGYKWREATCASCSAKVGWHFELSGLPEFWALIWSALKEPELPAEKLPTSLHSENNNLQSLTSTPGTQSITGRFYVPNSIKFDLPCSLLPRVQTQVLSAEEGEALALQQVKLAADAREKAREKGRRKKQARAAMAVKGASIAAAKLEAKKVTNKRAEAAGPDKVGQGLFDPDLVRLAAALRPAQKDQEKGNGRIWIVTGGQDSGGIIVRRQESIASAQISSRLCTGAQVEELERKGNRLHYKRIRGDGPDWGWVSVASNQKVLLQPMPDIDD